jgi:hypothetical protein
MADQHGAVAAGAAQPESLTLASLPRALLSEVFARTPVDARARCAAVCKTWRDVLLERSLWPRLDLSPAGGVARALVTDALLRGAAAKARGGLTALDVSGCRQLKNGALLKVVTANAGALTELCVWCGTERIVSIERVEPLLGVAPLLRVCHADVTAAAGAAPRRMLHNKPPFGPLRLHRLVVQAPWPGGAPCVRALAADLTASASSLSELLLSRAPLAGHGALDAVVDAALARRLPALTLSYTRLSAASVPALARLLGGNTLNTLVIQVTGDEPLLLSGAEGSAALLAAALRANNTLTVLGMKRANIWRDATAAETLLGALTAHPSLQKLRLDANTVHAASARARAGASLGALVAANAPALEMLSVSHCALGDSGLGPLVDALPLNTHLHTLRLGDNAMSDAFALNRLLPALLANTSLRQLQLLVGSTWRRGLRGLESLVAARAAARAAATSGAAP